MQVGKICTQYEAVLSRSLWGDVGVGREVGREAGRCMNDVACDSEGVSGVIAEHKAQARAGVTSGPHQPPQYADPLPAAAECSAGKNSIQN